MHKFNHSLILSILIDACQQKKEAIHVTHPLVLTLASLPGAAKPRHCSLFVRLAGVRHQSFRCLTKARKFFFNQSTCRQTMSCMFVGVGGGE